jgi:hypothetical protein
VTSRREFLRSGLAVSAAFVSSLTLLPANAAQAAPLRLERFVFDSRFAAAVQAARLAAARGIVLAETAGDLTNLWYHDLDLRWRRAPMTLAGITTKGALFVLETFAADRGMRVLYRGEHGAVDAGRAPVHTLAGRADLFADLMPAALAKGRRALADRDEPLCSWIIAPRSAVAAAV